MTAFHALAALALLGNLSGCGLLPKVGPDYHAVAPVTAPAWQAPLPHGGDPATLADWWAQWEDPLLAELIAAVERASPDLPQAWARIEQARANQVAAGVRDHPSLNASANATRSSVLQFGPATEQSIRQFGVLSDWEIDLFGGIARGKEGAAANYTASRQRWHAARVSLAAETALAYMQTRFLESRLRLAEADLASRRETSRLTRTLADAGLQSAQAASLAEAGAADASAALTSLRADHAQQVKALVALSGIAESELRARLSTRAGAMPRPRQFHVAALPAAVLAQRPDLAAAERDVAAASAAIGQADARRYPRLQLLGNLTPMHLSTGGASYDANTWSIGGGLLMPLIDGGSIDASVDAARAQYQAALAGYRQKARDAVREVEQALVRLDAAEQREKDLDDAAAGYRDSLAATRARHQAGLATPLELEEASRMALAAETNLAAWQHERAAAWVDLYRAVGGGWQVDADLPSPDQPTGNPS